MENQVYYSAMSHQVICFLIPSAGPGMLLGLLFVSLNPACFQGPFPLQSYCSRMHRILLSLRPLTGFASHMEEGREYKINRETWRKWTRNFDRGICSLFTKNRNWWNIFSYCFKVALLGLGLGLFRHSWGHMMGLLCLSLLFKCLCAGHKVMLPFIWWKLVQDYRTTDRRVWRFDFVAHIRSPFLSWFHSF